MPPRGTRPISKKTANPYKSVDDVLQKIHIQVHELLIHASANTSLIDDEIGIRISDKSNIQQFLKHMDDHIDKMRKNILANARKKIAYEYSMTRRIHPRMREYVNRTGDIKLYRDAYLPYKENVDVLYAKSRKSVKSFDKAYQNRYAKVLEFRKKFYTMSGKIIEEF